MKVWNSPEVMELDINETAQHCWGKDFDGGYIGDGHLGILGEKCTEDNPCAFHRGNGSGNTPS